MMNIAGLILAGGRSSRMGGSPKALIDLAGMMLLDRTIARFAPQVADLAVNLPPDLEVPGLRLPVLRDEAPTYEGPLAGILAGLKWASTLPSRPSHLLTVPVDLPFLPILLAERLAELVDHPDTLVFARGGEGDAPLCALWPLSATLRLSTFLGTNRRVKSFIASEQSRSLVFEEMVIKGKTVDPFFNINTPNDLAEAAELIAADGPWSSRRA